MRGGSRKDQLQAKHRRSVALMETYRPLSAIARAESGSNQLIDVPLVDFDRPALCSSRSK